MYALSLFVPIAICYFAVGFFVLKHNTVQSFLFWVTEYGHKSTYWVSSLKDALLGTLNGYLMVFFHRPLLGPGILQYDLSLALEEGRFLKGFLKKVFGYYSLGFLFFCYLAALYNLKKYVIQYGKAAVFCLSWLAPYVLFQLFFMPTNYFYKLFVFVPLLTIFAWYGLVKVEKEKRWLKLAIYFAFIIFTALSEPILALLVSIFVVAFEIFPDRKEHIYRWGLFILVAFLALYNYIVGIAPESKLEKNPEVKTALALVDDFRPGDLLIFQGGYDYPDGWIISALTPAKVVTLEALHRMGEKEADAMIHNVVSSGGRVFIHPNIIECTDSVKASAEELGLSIDDFLGMLDKYKKVPAFEEGGKIYLQIELSQ